MFFRQLKLFLIRGVWLSPMQVHILEILYVKPGLTLEEITEELKRKVP